jgi:hypothetical protein
MDQNPLVARGIVIAVLAAALVLIAARLRDDAGGEAYNFGFYYNLSTQELFVDSNRQLPPIRDGQAVAAYVFSCRACDDKASRFIGWLEMYTDEAKASLAAPPSSDPADVNAAAEMAAHPVIESGHMIALEPQDDGEPQWVAANTMDASRIQQAVLTKCGGKQARPCSPGAGELP